MNTSARIRSRFQTFGRAKPTFFISIAVSISLAVCLPVVIAAGSHPVRFVDVTREAGIRFRHNAGRTGLKWLPETMGAGCAFFDADGDGWLDIFLVNGRDLRGRSRRTTSALYRNNRNGTFTDVTAGSGLDVELYGMGVAIADYDNDGLLDVYVTALGPDRLFRNLGGGKFRDVTREAKIRNDEFASSAAWLDYDRDGFVDLFVCNYVSWTPQTDLWCSLDGTSKSYCTPESYPRTQSKLFRNRGDGTFEDVSEKAGIAKVPGKALGVAVLDFDRDGWPDIFVANDTEPNKLFWNRRNGTFQEIGMQAGVAYSEDGVARGAMGVDAVDYDRSGYPHLAIGNFSNEMINLYHNEGKGFFIDEAPRSEVGRRSLLTLAFGLFFFDYDLDGWQDLFVANGHIEDDVARVQPRVTYAQPPHLFRNTNKGVFVEVTEKVGDLHRPMVARGAAYGDYDRDGDLDVLVTTNNGPAHLFRNDGGNRNRWLSVHLVGRRSNRSGIGAIVRVKSASGEQWQMVRSGSSYCSQSQLDLVFGLGQDSRVDTLVVEWPSGHRQIFHNVAANRFVTVDETKGLLLE